MRSEICYNIPADTLTMKRTLNTTINRSKSEKNDGHDTRLADAFPHRFSTKYFDTETGLYYYGYRYYSPSLMRWINRDPIEEDGGLNLYSSCNNAVLYLLDILGLKSPCDCLSTTVVAMRRCNWSSLFAAERTKIPISNGMTIRHTVKSDSHGLVRHEDSLESLVASVDETDNENCRCYDSYEMEPFVSIDSDKFHVVKCPWSCGFSMEGKKFTNNSTTANLMPRYERGHARQFKVRVWFSTSGSDIDCLNLSFTVIY